MYNCTYIVRAKRFAQRGVVCATAGSPIEFVLTQSANQTRQSNNGISFRRSIKLSSAAGASQLTAVTPRPRSFTTVNNTSTAVQLKY